MGRPLSRRVDAVLRAWLAPMDLSWCVVAESVAPDSASMELFGVFVSDTADLLRLDPPSSILRRGGYADDRDVVLEAVELGEALRRLLAGDSVLLEAVFSHRNVISSAEHEHLVERARDGLHRGFVDDLVRRAGVRQEAGTDDDRRAAAGLLLRAGHLTQTGVVVTDAAALAIERGVSEVLAGVPTDGQLKRARASVRGAAASSPLPRAHPRPAAFDEFLLYVREAHWRR